MCHHCTWGWTRNTHRLARPEESSHALGTRIHVPLRAKGRCQTHACSTRRIFTRHFLLHLHHFLKNNTTRWCQHTTSWRHHLGGPISLDRFNTWTNSGRVNLCWAGRIESGLIDSARPVRANLSDWDCSVQTVQAVRFCPIQLTLFLWIWFMLQVWFG